VKSKWIVKNVDGNYLRKLSDGQYIDWKPGDAMATRFRTLADLGHFLDDLIDGSDDDLRLDVLTIEIAG
jgi:hypothetical protein